MLAVHSARCSFFSHCLYNLTRICTVLIAFVLSCRLDADALRAELERLAKLQAQQQPKATRKPQSAKPPPVPLSQAPPQAEEPEVTGWGYSRLEHLRARVLDLS